MEIFREAFPHGWMKASTAATLSGNGTTLQSGREMSLSWPQLTGEFLILKNKPKTG